MPVHEPAISGFRCSAFDVRCSMFGINSPNLKRRIPNIERPTSNERARPVHGPNACEKNRKRAGRADLPIGRRLNASTSTTWRAAAQAATVPTFRLDGGTVPHQKMQWHFQKPYILRRWPRCKPPKKRIVPFDGPKFT